MPDEQDRLGAAEREIAVIITELRSIKDTLARLDGKLDAYQSNYVPRNELNEMFRARDDQIHELRDAQKSAGTSWRQWVSIFIAAAAFLYAVWPKQ